MVQRAQRGKPSLGILGYHEHIRQKKQIQKKSIPSNKVNRQEVEDSFDYIEDKNIAVQQRRMKIQPEMEALDRIRKAKQDYQGGLKEKSPNQRTQTSKNLPKKKFIKTSETILSPSVQEKIKQLKKEALQTADANFNLQVTQSNRKRSKDSKSKTKSNNKRPIGISDSLNSISYVPPYSELTGQNSKSSFSEYPINKQYNSSGSPNNQFYANTSSPNPKSILKSSSKKIHQQNNLQSYDYDSGTFGFERENGVIRLQDQHEYV